MTDLTARLAVAALRSAADDLRKTCSPANIDFSTPQGSFREKISSIVMDIGAGKKVSVHLLGYLVLYFAQEIEWSMEGGE